MQVLVIENYPETPLGQVGRALDEAGIAARVVPAHAGAPVPESPGEHAGLVVFGGAQDALDDAGYPFLPKVCDLIRAFHAADRPVLGICLGAQLIARAFGGTNILGRPVEFGWRPVTPTPAAVDDPLFSVLGDGAPLFHWHSDTFTLPEGALHLAASAMTENQGFRLGRATYATQFHFETGLAEARFWSERFADLIAEHTPDWADRFEGEARIHAPASDVAGAALARAWVGLLRP